jgi:hypothetical protein
MVVVGLQGSLSFVGKSSLVLPVRSFTESRLVGKGCVDAFERTIAFWTLIEVGKVFVVREAVAANKDQHAASMVAGLIFVADTAVVR